MEADKTTIDGFTFELRMLPAWQHTEASLHLVQILGPAVKPIALLFQGGSGLKGEALDLQMMGAILQVLRTAKVSDVLDLAKMMLADCIIGGDLDNGQGKKKLAPLAPIFDQVLRGKLMTIYKLIAWAVKVNFSGFFADLQSALPAKAPSPSQESPTSTSPNQSAEGGPAAG